MLYPFTFRPRLKHRPWGGRHLGTLYGKPIGKADQIGESWEISDRADAQSIVANGPLAGQTLRQLITQHGHQLLGTNCRDTSRFPLLIKMLDARDRLWRRRKIGKVVAIKYGSAFIASGVW